MRQFFAIAIFGFLVGSSPSSAQDESPAVGQAVAQSASDYNKELLTIEEDVNSLKERVPVRGSEMSKTSGAQRWQSEQDSTQELIGRRQSSALSSLDVASL